MLAICTGNLIGLGALLPRLNAAAKRRWSQAHGMQSEEKRRRVKIMMYKKLTKSGSITIPRKLRREAGMLPGTPVVVERFETGIHIRKHVPVCFHCGTVEQVAEFDGIEICKACAGKLMGVFANG
jgi:transcriptional pleiotropic regulator of transition state genes